MRHKNIHEEINDSCFYLIRKESVLIPCNVQLYYTKYLQSRHTQVMATHRVSGNFNYRFLILEWSVVIQNKCTFLSLIVSPLCHQWYVNDTKEISHKMGSIKFWVRFYTISLSLIPCLSNIDANFEVIWLSKTLALIINADGTSRVL